jgi:hypothetical protein
MEKTTIIVPNAHVEHLVKEMSFYNPVVVDLPDYLPHHNELKDLVFDLETANTSFLSHIFFAGINLGIKITMDNIASTIGKVKNTP